MVLGAQKSGDVRTGGSFMSAGCRLRASFVSLIVALLMFGAATVPAASASEGCSNEMRRDEQGSLTLPDCRGYELVSQPYQPTPDVTPFLAFQGVPRAVSTEFEYYSNYYSEPKVLPTVQVNAFTGLDGRAVAYKGEEPNAEANEIESPINLSRHASEGWIGENILPHESAKSGYGCRGTTVEGVSLTLEQIAIRLGGGEPGVGEDYEHCSHDEPYLFTEAEGESRETANLTLRASGGHSWSLVSIYPLGVTTYNPGAADSQEYSQYNPIFDAVSVDGSTAIFASQAQLTSDAPNGETLRLTGEVNGHCPTELGNVYVWGAGVDRVLTVPPDGIPVRGTLAGAHAGSAFTTGCARQPQQTAAFTNSVAADGRRAIFYAGGGFKIDARTFSTGPRAPYIDGGLYLRENPSAGQSSLAQGGAAGTGTLTAGSDAVSTLHVTLAAGVGRIDAGSNEVRTLATLTGKFAVGQAIEGQGVPTGTTIREITERSRTLESGATESYPVVVLSSNATESVEDDKLAAVSEGPAPFAIGQTIVGRGIPADTTVTAVTPGSLTLSNNATASGSEVSLESSSQCTESEKACTVQIDAPQAGASGSPGEGQFQWANVEATKVFFTDEEKLTSNSTAVSGKPDLYEYDIERPQGQRLADLTSNVAEPADVVGVPGVSEDGSYVYFVANGVLAENENTHHGKAQAGKANLYLRHSGTTTFIATLDAEGGDQCDWTAWCLTSRVSQNGLYIAFDSIDSLTGYDNMPVKPTACNYLTSGNPTSTEEAPCIEAYRYAAGEGPQGTLTCATCNPRGRPEAEFAWALVRQAYREGPSKYGDQITIDHPMADTGQFFFETEEKLVSADENGNGHESVDVYEYSGGEGPTAQYSLISTGKSDEASEFLDASADGSNVFFSTDQSLLSADTRVGYDIYDARVNGGFASQDAVTPEPCEPIDGCRSQLTERPGEFFVGSAGFFGAGNITPAPESKPVKCRNGFVRRRGRCVRAHPKKHHKKHRKTRGHHRASHNHRRAGK